MSEDETKQFRSERDLLEQVVTKLEVMDTRLQYVESKIKDRAFDTKPIWEKALAEIIEVKERITMLDRKITVFNADMLVVKAEHVRTDDRLPRLES